MTELVPRTLDPAAGRAEIDTVAGVLAGAFAEEPYFKSILGSDAGDDGRARRLFALQVRHQYLPHGVVDLVEVDGQPAGVGLWAPPGSSAGSMRSQLRLLHSYLRLLGRRVGVAMLGEIAGGRMHPVFPHWYLYMLGTHPDFRGLGVGGRLLAHRTQQLAGAPAYLEASTPDSARLYARHGFIELGEIPMRGMPWPLKGMWRPGTPH